MKKMTFLLSIILINIFFFILNTHINYQSKKYVSEFEKDIRGKLDTNNLPLLITEYNRWVGNEHLFGYIYQIEMVDSKTKNKTFVSSKFFDNMALWSPKKDEFKFWQFITHVFMHGGFFHIFFNMFSLITLSVIILRSLSILNYTGLYIGGGIFASLTHIIFTSQPDIPMVGASGAIWALFGFFAYKHAEERLSLFFLPIYIKAKKLFVSMFIIELLLAILSINNTDGLAHWAHTGGGIFGIIFFYYKQQEKNKS